MDYHFEFLGDERFQKLCQALLAASFPDMQCFPLNQADGGRDAVVFRRKLKNEQERPFSIFQVKYSNAPSTKTERDTVDALISSEKDKVRRLIGVGAKSFYLLTNVSGTGALRDGSIDKINNRLTEEFGIPSYCWWRDDLERRVDSHANLKWSYPEMLRGTDVLELLLHRPSTNGASERRARIIKAYIAVQYKLDEEVKFKQVQLQNRILDLFVDVPVRIQKISRDSIANHNLSKTIYADSDRVSWSQSEIVASATDAARFLLDSATAEAVPFLVLEGAPGQGKSTITQYLCQVHRMHLLGKADDLSCIPSDHSAQAVRLPLRIDLRDFATWLNGRSPFASTHGQPLEKSAPRTLESFISAQISEGSGGQSFSLDDLALIITNSDILVVLDGLDEVADISTREKMVREVSIAAARLKEGARSLQMVVTSRPAAFANSPGFSTRDWPHFELQSLTRDQIAAYADKWMTARQLTAPQKAEFSVVLNGRLEQDHIRDLSRNPMQLAILLALINTKGLSLPDKRTALYDSYVDLFFGREAEKSEIVREQRELLIMLHRYLAWKLQTEAEAGEGSGSIDGTRLKRLLKEYLASHGHDQTLVEDLFQGMVERVVALVSRVQGTYEFEVQPLREYFTARHLYENAPYSPPGQERSGTKPEIFSALARRFYWLNVTRFYAGCYSSGELASLVDGIEDLISDDEFGLTSYPRRLAAMLLGDWVFAQQPTSVKRVVEAIASGPGLLTYLATQQQTNFGGAGLVLPIRCGRKELVSRLMGVLEASHPTPRDAKRAILAIIRANLDPAEIAQEIKSWRGRLGPTTEWAEFIVDIGGGNILPDEDLINLYRELGAPGIDVIISGGRIEVLLRDENLLSATCDRVLSGAQILVFPGHLRSEAGGVREVLEFAYAFEVWVYGNILNSTPDDMALGDGLTRLFGPEAAPAKASDDTSPQMAPGVLAVVAEFRQLKQVLVGELKTAIAPWSVFVEAARAHWGDRWAIYEVAAVVAGVKSRVDRGAKGQDFHDDSIGLCQRARFARLKSGQPNWWRQQISSARGLSKQFLLLLLFSWGTPNCIGQLSSDLNSTLEKLSDEDWTRLYDSVRRVIFSTQWARGSDPRFGKANFWDQFSERGAVLLALRAPEKVGVEILLQRFLGYDGPDKKILAFIADQAEALIADYPKHRKAGIGIVRALYGLGVYAPGYRYNPPGGEHRFPITLSREVCRDPQSYPLYLLGWGDRSVSAAIGKQSVKIGDVAIADGWAVGGAT